MALHPRLGEECPLWAIARILDGNMKKTLKAGKKLVLREKVSGVSLWLGLGNARA